MKYYIIFTQEIYSIGGMQLYTAGKAQYLESKGWNVIVFHPDFHIRRCEYSYLDKFIEYCNPYIEIPTSAYSLKEIKKIILDLIEYIECSDVSDIYVESHYDIGATWAERFAQYVEAPHICFNCNELFRGKNKIYEYILDYFWDKYKHNELFGIEKNSMSNLFRGYSVNEFIEPRLFDPVEINPIQDVIDTRINKISGEADYTIMYLGRSEKGYMNNILNGVASFALEHQASTIQFVIVGDTKSIKKELYKLFSHLKNVNVVEMGKMIPIPLSIYSKIDVVIAGSGSAEISARQHVPTIVADCVNYNAIGVLGYDTQNSMSSDDVDTLKPFSKILSETLIEKKYLNYEFRYSDDPNPAIEYDKQLSCFAQIKNHRPYNMDKTVIPINYWKYKFYLRIKKLIFKMEHRIVLNNNE